MFRLSICALVLGLFQGGLSQKCDDADDCINFDQCPPALNLAVYNRSPETMQLFREAACGFDKSGSVPKAMVCCSMFSPTEKSGSDTETPEDIRITNHKNMHLLPDDCGNIKGDRIVGGEEADLYEFPWMALIAHDTRDGVQFKCGGSIINKRYILTAAHCVYKRKLAGVRVGEYNIDTEIDCQKGVCEKHKQDIRIEKALMHQDYRGLPSVVNDIALLRLDTDVDFDHRNVHRICLPKTSKLRHRALSTMLATVAGWGRTENHTESAILRKVNIPIHSAQQCSGTYNRFSRPGDKDATADQLCAGTTNKDSCNGDSGGPLMLEEKYNNIFRYVQYGVVSHGPQKCGSEYPGVYTDVTKFMGWILDNIY